MDDYQVEQLRVCGELGKAEQRVVDGDETEDVAEPPLAQPGGPLDQAEPVCKRSKVSARS